MDLQEFIYSAEPGTYDEMLDGEGRVRPHWEYMMRAFRGLGPAGLERRRMEAEKLLRENGVTYNAYDDPGRPWQLDPVPLLVSSEEWSQIESGLLERAELLNLILSDLYGPRELIRKKLLPLELIYGHGGFLRACDGIRLRGHHQLIVYAADLARGPDNRMWVLGDRTQAPSGAGYALENRVAMTRILPSLFRDSHVHRLALFFQSLRAGLQAIAPEQAENPRVVVLTPGPLNETFFEHAYLAAYLGYTLVQGEDLTVSGGHVWLKSLSGLEHVDVILRRVDDDYCDPLELREDSRLGVAGLVEAARRGNVAIANPLGSSILENPGMLAFLPGIAAHFLGRELRLPSAATWWCGQKLEMDYVLNNLERLVIKPTYRSPGARPVFGSLLDKASLEYWREKIKARPHAYVGQEQEGFSTVPALSSGEFVPRHAVLRSFIVSRPDGYTVMPGGLTRSATLKGDMLVSNQDGGISKDTWVLASEPEKLVSIVMKPTPEQVAVARGTVSSRVADNLFWVGRYAERAEGTIRLLRAVIGRLYYDPDSIGSEYGAATNCLLQAVMRLTGTYPGFFGEADLVPEPDAELFSVILDEGRAGSLAYTLRSLMRSGLAVRDLWSQDAWRVLEELEQHLSDAHTLAVSSDLLHEMDRMINALSAFGGLVMESMARGGGWIFLDMGRRLERGMMLFSLLKSTLTKRQGEFVEELLVEAALEASDNLIGYRQYHRNSMELPACLELLLLDERNPRSAVYQAARLEEHAASLPRHRTAGRLGIEERYALEASSALRLVDLDDLSLVDATGARQNLEQLLARMGYLFGSFSNALTSAYFRHEHSPQTISSLRTA